MKFTIIVPVYNVEKYITKCIDSILSQSYYNYEIIFVNDGSTDNSGNLISSYVEKFNNIKVINQSNKGLSAARDTGIKYASGEYILFVDSDDFIENDTLSFFYKVLTQNNIKYDMISGSSNVLFNNKKKSSLNFSLFSNKSNLSGKEFFKYQLKQGTMHMPVWLFVFRKEFLLQNDLTFQEGILHEDEEFTPRALMICNKIYLSNHVFYNYIIRKNSITNAKSKINNSINLIQTCLVLKNTYLNVSDPEFKFLLLNSIASKYLSAFQVSQIYRLNEFNLKHIDFFKGIRLTNRLKIKYSLFKFSKTLYYYLFQFINGFRKLIFIFS